MPTDTAHVRTGRRATPLTRAATRATGWVAAFGLALGLLAAVPAALVLGASPAQADQPGTHLPDTEQRCHLSVAEAKRLGDDRHEYRKSLIVKVGGAVPQRETGQDESTAAPALQGRLRYLIHCDPLFSCRIMRGG